MDEYQNAQYIQSNHQYAHCINCGTALINGVCPNCSGYQSQAASKQNSNTTHFQRFFMNPNEKLVAALGNSYFQNYLYNGSISNGFAVVSDKRVYFQGKCYSLSTGGFGRTNLIKTKCSRCVDLKDVTGTGFIFISNLLLLIMACLSLLITIVLCCISASNIDDPSNILMGGLVMFLVYVVGYFFSKRTLITIQYAGGEIGFDIKWFSQREAADFQMLLRLAKDKVIEDADCAVANKFSDALNNFIYMQMQYKESRAEDELLEYGEPLKPELNT